LNQYSGDNSEPRAKEIKKGFSTQSFDDSGVQPGSLVGNCESKQYRSNSRKIIFSTYQNKNDVNTRLGSFLDHDWSAGNLILTKTTDILQKTFYGDSKKSSTDKENASNTGKSFFIDYPISNKFNLETLINLDPELKKCIKMEGSALLLSSEAVFAIEDKYYDDEDKTYNAYDLTAIAISQRYATDRLFTDIVNYLDIKRRKLNYCGDALSNSISAFILEDLGIFDKTNSSTIKFSSGFGRAMDASFSGPAPLERPVFHPIYGSGSASEAADFTSGFNVVNEDYNLYGNEPFMDRHAIVIFRSPYGTNTADDPYANPNQDIDMLKTFLHEFIHSWSNNYSFDEKLRESDISGSYEVDLIRHNSLCSGHAEKSCIFRYGNENLINLNFVKTGLPVCDMHKLIMLNRLLR